MECLPGFLFTTGIFQIQIACINSGLCVLLPQSSLPTNDLFWIHSTHKTNLCSNIFIRLGIPFAAGCLIKVIGVCTVTTTQSLQWSYYPRSVIDCKSLSVSMDWCPICPHLPTSSAYLFISVPQLQWQMLFLFLLHPSSLLILPLRCNSSLTWFQQLHHLFLSLSPALSPHLPLLSVNSCHSFDDD